MDFSVIEIFKDSLQSNNIDVQTIRLCTPPFSQHTTEKNEYFKNYEQVLSIIEDLRKHGIINYYSFLPGLCDQTSRLTHLQKMFLKKIPSLIEKYNSLFSSVQVSSSKGGISLEAIKQWAQIIKVLSKSDPFMNLQFAATFNVPPNTPFFPSSYHSGDKPKITIALEAADEIVQITENSTGKTLEQLRVDIQSRFAEIYDSISRNLEPLCEKKRSSLGE